MFSRFFYIKFVIIAQIMTVREIISTVRNSVKSINLDDRLSNRYIYSILMNYSSFLIKRDADARRIFKLAHLFKTVDCFEMEEKPLTECCSILLPSVKKVMRSKFKLPTFYNTIYGNLLNVYSLDGTITYNYGTPSSYKSFSKREFKPKDVGFYWIHNGYLVIPDSDISVVTLRGMFQNKHEVDTLNGEMEDSCLSKLDEEFTAPDYLVADILKATITDIRNITVPIMEDNNPNRNQTERQVQADGE